MNQPAQQSTIPKIAIVFVILSVIALAIIFVVMASVGDDVPTELPAATTTSTGE
jgi:hypothetical protein